MCPSRLCQVLRSGVVHAMLACLVHRLCAHMRYSPLPVHLPLAMTFDPRCKVQSFRSNVESMPSLASLLTEMRRRVACRTYRTSLRVSFHPFPQVAMILPHPMAAIEVPLMPPTCQVGMVFSSTKSERLGEQWLMAPESR